MQQNYLCKHQWLDLDLLSNVFKKSYFTKIVSRYLLTDTYIALLQINK